MDYELVPATPTAECPRCGRRVKIDADYVGTFRGACRHVLHAERIEGLLFVAFLKAKPKPPQDHK